MKNRDKKPEVIVLSELAFARVRKFLRNPPTPNQKLRELATRYAATVASRDENNIDEKEIP